MKSPPPPLTDPSFSPLHPLPGKRDLFMRRAHERARDLRRAAQLPAAAGGGARVDRRVGGAAVSDMERGGAAADL